MKDDYCIIALFASGREYLVEEGLTFEEACDRQEELNSRAEGGVLYQLGEGPVNNMERLNLNGHV